MTHTASNFNLWIVVNGNEQRIVNGVVNIPFGTEYAIRVRNNNDCRAEFSISIDGLEDSSRFVLNPYQTMTIERFVGNSLTSGSKFKFVEEGNASVQTPGSSYNGEIEVKFWKELVYTPPIVLVNDWHKPWRYDLNDWVGGTGDKYDGSGITWSSDTGYGDAQFSAKASSPRLKMTFGASALQSSFTSNVGATIEGSHSSQNFLTVDGFATEIVPTILKVTLRGLPTEEPKPRRVPRVVKSTKVKYCTNCGTQHELIAKFCVSCGKKF